MDEQATASVQPRLDVSEGNAYFYVPTTEEFSRLHEVVAGIDKVRRDHEQSDEVMTAFKVRVTRNSAYVVMGIATAFGIDVPEDVVRELSITSRQSSRIITQNDASTLHIEYPTTDRQFYDLNSVVDAIPNRTYVAANESGQKAIDVPFSPEQCDVIETTLVGKFKFDVNPGLMLQIQAMAAGWRKTLELSTAIYGEMEVEGLNGTLLPYQKVAVAYGLLTERFILADVQGLGKTVEALALLKAANAFPALIICPAISRWLVWAKHLASWLPGITATVATPKTPQLAYALFDVIIVSYDSLQNKNVQDGIQIMKQRDPALAAVLMDESQYIKSFTAQRTKTILQIVKGVRYRVAITGTPVMNRPAELVPQLEAIGQLDDFGGRAWFDRTYSHWGVAIDPDVARGLNKRLRQRCMIRRTADDVAEDLRNLKAGKLPRAVETTVMDAAYNAEYELAMNNLLDWIAQQAEQELAENATFTDVTETEKGRFIEHKTGKAARAATLVKLNALRKIIGMAKVDAAVRWIEQFHEDNPDRKLVVFAQHKEVLQALALQLDGVLITGDTSEPRRIQAVNDFQECSAADVPNAFVSIAAAGLSITLTAASDELFVELDWSAGKLSQAEARCDRIGQKTPVKVTYLLGETGFDTDEETGSVDIDTMVFSLLEQKFAMMQAVTDGDGAAGQTGDVLDELIQELAKRAAKRAAGAK